MAEQVQVRAVEFVDENEDLVANIASVSDSGAEDEDEDQDNEQK
jgi:hypothetical protein